MLIDNNGLEHFRNMSRKQINKRVSGHCRGDSVCEELHQAKALSPLREVFTPTKFPIQESMGKPFKHCAKGERL